MSQNIVYSGTCSMGAWKQSVVYCQVNCFINVDEILLSTGVEFIYIPAEFLSACNNCKKEVLKTSTLTVLLAVFPLSSINFWFKYFSNSTIFFITHLRLYVLVHYCFINIKCPSVSWYFLFWNMLCLILI